jgi:hypothetical protein
MVTTELRSDARQSEKVMRGGSSQFDRSLKRFVRRVMVSAPLVRLILEVLRASADIWDGSEGARFIARSFGRLRS